MLVNKNKGISLIVLVITIIVIIILAGTVILSLSSNNPISQAAKATFLSDVRNFQAELTLHETKEFTDKLGAYDITLLQADETSVTYGENVDNSITMNDLIPTLGKTKKYAGQFVVIDGELVYQGSDNSKQNWSVESGLKVEILGEPKVTIVPPTETVVVQGTDIIYTVKFTSNAALSKVDLSSKVEVTDNLGVALVVQPTIILGTVSGTNVDNTRQATVTIKTDSLLNGAYKLKIKAGSATNINDISNLQDTISPIGFDIDSAPPENPTMSADPATWTNGDVYVTIAYSEDSKVKEYSLDGTSWHTYSVPVIVSTNNTTVYAKGKDNAGNESGLATLTVANIDKVVPIVTATNGGKTSSSVTVTATASDVGGSGINGESYQYSKDNGTTWTPVTNVTSYTFTGLLTGTYQCKVKVVDNVGNSTTSSAVAISTQALGTITLAANPTALTNGDVNVTITYPAEVITKQYSTDGTTWNTYTSPIVISTNNTTVYAKGLDAGGNQTAQATLTVANIDKTPPTTPTFSASPTTPATSVTVTINYPGDASVKQYSTDGTNWSTYTTGIVVTTNGTTIYARCSDSVGNVSGVSTITIVNITVPTAGTPVATDVADNGDGRDIKVDFNGCSSESTVTEYRIFVVKNTEASSFTTDIANSLDSTMYVTVAKTGNNALHSLTLMQSLKASDGSSIINGVSYKIFVMTVANSGYVNNLSVGSNDLMLTTLVSNNIDFETESQYTQQSTGGTEFINGGVQLQSIAGSTDTSLNFNSATGYVIQDSTNTSITGGVAQLNPQVLSYTGDVCTGGTAISGGDYTQTTSPYATSYASYAFDSNSSTSWGSPHSGSAASGDYIGYTFSQSRHIRRITITTGNAVPYTFMLQYKNSGGTWINVQSISVSTNLAQTYDIVASQSSTSWRLLVTSAPANQLAWMYEIDMMEAVTGYPTTGYNITTGTNQINTSAKGVINNINVVQTTPTNTQVKYLVSFDNKTTWKAWNGSSWVNVTLTNIHTSGMTKATLEAITQTQWSTVYTPGTLNIAVGLKTSTTASAPSVDQINVVFGTSYAVSSYYVRTTTGSKLDSSNWKSIKNIVITDSQPTNTQLKYAISFDGGTTWKTRATGTWQSVTLANIHTQGMTKTQIEAITQDQWSETGGFGTGKPTIDMAVGLNTTSVIVTPSVDNISIYNYQ